MADSLLASICSLAYKKVIMKFLHFWQKTSQNTTYISPIWASYAVLLWSYFHLHREFICHVVSCQTRRSPKETLLSHVDTGVSQCDVALHDVVGSILLIVPKWPWTVRLVSVTIHELLLRDWRHCTLICSGYQCGTIMIGHLVVCGELYFVEN